MHKMKLFSQGYVKVTLGMSKTQPRTRSTRMSEQEMDLDSRPIRRTGSVAGGGVRGGEPGLQSQCFLTYGRWASVSPEDTRLNNLKNLFPNL